MTLGGNSDGGGTLALSPDEMKRFLSGEAVKKVSGDANGVFVITVKLTRPRKREDRYPEQIYGGVE